MQEGSSCLGTIMNNKVAVILVNFKTYANRFLEECRDSLRRQTYPADLIHIFIVDNATSKESNDYIRMIYPEAVIIPRNDGNYAAANNAGIMKGMEYGCEYFIIANMDTVFDSNWMRELIGAIKSDDNIGIAQSKILLYPINQDEWKSPKINSVGNVIHYLGFGLMSGYRKHDDHFSIEHLGKEIYPEIHGYASGCSFITKKEVLAKIGGYNEEYYMYHDDVEISWKVKLAGYKIVLAPNSILYHKFEPSRSAAMRYYLERNRYIAVFSFYKWPTLILISPALIFMDVGMFFYSFVHGWFKIKLDVYKYFLKFESWRKIAGFRKVHAALRVVSDKKIVYFFYGKILFQENDASILKYCVNPIFSIYWAVAKNLIVW